MIDFSQNTTAIATCVSANYSAEETARIKRFNQKISSKKNYIKKQLTKENKKFLKLIGLLK